MATLYVRALDATTGRPVVNAAVTIIPTSSTTAAADFVASGFTNTLGDFYATVPGRIGLKLLFSYTISVAAKGYSPTTGVRTVIGNNTYYYTNTNSSSSSHPQHHPNRRHCSSQRITFVQHMCTD